MASQRQQRVARQILHEISSIVGRDVSDPRVEGVTFTEVRVTPDLRNAHVYFSCLGGADERRRCSEGLEHAAGMLRRELGRRLALRFVPTLRFEIDDSLERAERIARLLRQSGRDAEGGEADEADEHREPGGSAGGHPQDRDDTDG
jgi:ribosome-binding factor A